MENEFTFQSVGHGLFYTGSLSDGEYNFVYDCGEKGKEHLEKAIENYMINAKDIDFLVVSHLHEDHVCGVYYLKEKLKQEHKKIKKIYLPYMYDRLIIKLAIVHILMTGQKQRRNFLEILYWWISLLDDNKSNYDQDDYKPEVVIVGEKKFDKEQSIGIEKFHFLKEGKLYWHFKMFNKIKKTKKEQIDIVAIKKDIKNILNDKEIEDCFYSESYWSELQKIYEKYFSDINNSSTILIHYPANNSVSFVSKGYRYFRCCLHNRCFDRYLHNRLLRYSSCYLYNRLLRCLDRYLHNRLLRYSDYYLYNRLFNEHPVITILTGDAKFDEDMLSKMRYIVNNIPNQKYGTKIFQVPHHGSSDNWKSMKSAKFSFDIYVISSKYEDEKHPDREMLSELRSERKHIRLVTQFVEYFYGAE